MDTILLNHMNAGAKPPVARRSKIPMFHVVYMDMNGRHCEVTHDINDQESELKFKRLIIWAAHKGIELRIRPIR